MESINTLLQQINFLQRDLGYKSRRDELFYTLLNLWNEDRKKAGYKPMSKARLAVAINSNPFLKEDDGELALLLHECQQKGNFKKAQWTLFPKK